MPLYIRRMLECPDMDRSAAFEETFEERPPLPHWLEFDIRDYDEDAGAWYLYPDQGGVRSQGIPIGWLTGTPPGKIITGKGMPGSWQEY